MNKFFGSVFMGFLVLSMSGCASYAPAYLPQETSLDEQSPNAEKVDREFNARLDGQDRVVKIGDEVKVTLIDGATHTGTVLWFSPGQVVLGKPCNYGECETMIELSDIAVLKSRYASRVALGAGVIVGVLSVTFLGLLMAFAASGGIGSN